MTQHKLTVAEANEPFAPLVLEATHLVEFVTHWGTSVGCEIVDTHLRSDCVDYRCTHEVFGIYAPAGIDAATLTVDVQCSECGKMGTASVQVDWS